MGGNARKGQKNSLDPEQTVKMLKWCLANLRAVDVHAFFLIALEQDEEGQQITIGVYVFGNAFLFHVREGEFVVLSSNTTYELFYEQCRRVKILLDRQYDRKYRMGHTRRSLRIRWSWRRSTRSCKR